MIKQIGNFVLIPLLTLPSARACDVLGESIADYQLRAHAYQTCDRVEGGGDAMTTADLDALTHLAAGNSGAAITARFGLPVAYCGFRAYYPVAHASDPLWTWIDLPGGQMEGWGYTTIPPLGG